MSVSATQKPGVGVVAAWLQRLLPKQVPLRNVERCLACLGALVGIAATGFVTRWSLGDSAAMPILIAPMGAAAVLVFAVPASPLAQPYAVLVGNTLSAFVGVAALMLFPDPVVAGAVAVAGAIGVMSLTRSIHPPGGAVALAAVLGGQTVADIGFAFAFTPVFLNALVLTMAGILFNNAARRSYPHVPALTHDAAPAGQAGVTLEDIEEALASQGERLDVTAEDLEVLFRDAQLVASRRRRGG